MKNLKQTMSLIVFLFCLIAEGLFAQNIHKSIPAAGGTASGAGGSATYTVGQVVYTTNVGSNGSVAQGIQQPFEISLVTGIPEAKGIDLVLSAYPNPSTDFLILKAENLTSLKLESLSYQLYDLKGKLIESKPIKGISTTITMSSLVPSVYFLRVYTQKSVEVKSFKIIKK